MLIGSHHHLHCDSHPYCKLIRNTNNILVQILRTDITQCLSCFTLFWMCKCVCKTEWMYMQWNIFYHRGEKRINPQNRKRICFKAEKKNSLKVPGSLKWASEPHNCGVIITTCIAFSNSASHYSPAHICLKSLWLCLTWAITEPVGPESICVGL